MKVLIVDDNPLNRKVLRVVLEGDGLQTAEAANGLEALALLEFENFDAVISDILMPEMDGYRLSRSIRQSERFAEVPLIIYSATYTSPPEAELALQCGADKFIPKPCPNEVMRDALQDLFHHLPARRSSPPDAAQQLAVMKRYSEVLVQKLEDKNESLEYTRSQLLRTNRELLERTEALENAKAQFERKTTELEQRLNELQRSIAGETAPEPISSEGGRRR